MDTVDSRHATAELLWGRRERPSRGPKPSLTIDDIARTAMRIADAEGIAAVSMQRVAAEVDFTKMAMYRYVSGKAELIAVMIEAAVGETPDLNAVRGGWRRKLELFASELAAAWERHPWLPWVTMGDRVMGPNELGWIECAVSALDDTGLDGAEQMDAVFVLCGHIRNTQSMTTAGTQPWTPDRQVSPTMHEPLDEHRDRYPALAAIMSSNSTPSRDNGREFGLQRLLDGLELLIASRAR